MISEHPESGNAGRDSPAMASPWQDSQRRSGAFEALTPGRVRNAPGPALQSFALATATPALACLDLTRF